jgi:hypothetical protein
MYNIITDIKEIYKAQLIFNKMLTNNTELFSSSLRFPNFHNNPNGRWYSWNGSKYIPDKDYIDETNIWWSDKMKMWVSIRKVKSLHTENWRYWNAFGFENPKHNKKLSITVEINFPETGIDRHIAGLLIKNEDGKIVVAHRGRFRKGNETITFDYLVKKTKFQVIDIKNGRNKIEVLKVGELQSNNFYTQVRNFVQNVYEVKNK